MMMQNQMQTHTLACVGSLSPIFGRSFLSLFWTLFLCNLFLFHLHTPEDMLEKKRKEKTRNRFIDVYHALSIVKIYLI